MHSRCGINTTYIIRSTIRTCLSVNTCRTCLSILSNRTTSGTDTTNVSASNSTCRIRNSTFTCLSRLSRYACCTDRTASNNTTNTRSTYRHSLLLSTLHSLNISHSHLFRTLSIATQVISNILSSLSTTSRSRIMTLHCTHMSRIRLI